MHVIAAILNWLERARACSKEYRNMPVTNELDSESFCSNLEPALISFMFIKPLLQMKFHSACLCGAELICRVD